MIQVSRSVLEPIQLCQHYGWDALLETPLLSDPKYLEFLNFLYDSHLLFGVRGYEVSLQHHSVEMSKGIQMIEGKPHLLKNGEWTPWDQILAEFTYSPLEGITRRHEPAKRRWDYLYPQGLMPIQAGHLPPAYQLSVAALDRLFTQSQTYFTETGAKPLSKEECAYVQAITDGEDGCDRIRHVAVRVIDNQGALYSVGFERLISEGQPKGFSLLSTFKAALFPLDFREFRKFQGKRRVTTLPINLETFQRVFSKVQAYAAQPLKHSYVGYNCAEFAASLLHDAGVVIDVKTASVTAILFNITAPKWMRKITDVAYSLFARIPQWITTPIEWVVIGLTFIPARLLSLIKNLIALILGANTGSPRIFKTWIDLFKDHPVSVPYKISDWQEKQPATQSYAFEGPKFYGI